MAANPPTREQTSLRRRLLDWLWRGREIEAVRARLAASDSLEEARERARVALELGDRAREPSEPFAPGPDPARACELYREAAHWAIVASNGEPVDAAVEPSCSAAEAAELGARARALVTAALADEMALQRLRRERRARVGLALALFAFAVFRAGLWLRDGVDLRHDLAQGKPWRLSSEALRCDPAQRRCGNHLGMSIFFHTARDASPWFELDLQREERISEVRVRNRTDCCSELALPLVVELSQDRKSWREVARRNGNFRNWKASFKATDARWVRLRVDRPSMLHLERVSVYR